MSDEVEKPVYLDIIYDYYVEYYIGASTKLQATSLMAAITIAETYNLGPVKNIYKLQYSNRPDEVVE